MHTLITGASAGIGLELARVFALHNHNLLLVARNEAALRDLASELSTNHGVDATIFVADLSKPEAPQLIHEFCAQSGIVVDNLVNNAGFGDYGPFHELDRKHQLDMIAVNIASLVDLTHRFLPGMVSQKSGKILNVASTAAFQPGPFMSVYYATKSFVLHFSEAISVELEGTGVTVTALCPGATRSEFQERANLNGSRLFDGRKLPTSKDVAEYGYTSLMRGKRVAIHGLLNMVLANSVRFSPRGVVLRIARFIQGKKN
jgi:short-subunit dehydrogenase